MKPKSSKNYLFISGVATGIIMAILSVLTSLKLIIYVEKGGSFLLSVVISIGVAVIVGIFIGWLINIMSD